jgi:hypothetical protein
MPWKIPARTPSWRSANGWQECFTNAIEYMNHEDTKARRKTKEEFNVLDFTFPPTGAPSVACHFN